jgi:hypothetical protein
LCQIASDDRKLNMKMKILILSLLLLQTAANAQKIQPHGTTREQNASELPPPQFNKPLRKKGVKPIQVKPGTEDSSTESQVGPTPKGAAPVTDSQMKPTE